MSLDRVQTLLFVVASESLTDLAADFAALGIGQECEWAPPVVDVLQCVFLAVKTYLCPGRQVPHEGFSGLISFGIRGNKDVMTELSSADAVKFR